MQSFWTSDLWVAEEPRSGIARIVVNACLSVALHPMGRVRVPRVLDVWAAARPQEQEAKS
jgi:hypothetical protein